MIIDAEIRILKTFFFLIDEKNMILKKKFVP